MVAIQRGGWGGEHSGRHHVRIVERIEEGAKELELHFFPAETALNIDWIHFGVGRQFRDQDRAIETSARKD
jgi:hypothetical protein